MGRVWAARRVGATVQRLVAVKTAIRENQAADPEFERAFVDEARIAAGIQHPNVCGIYELGQDRGVAYLVMEWSNGGSLYELLQARPDRKLEVPLAVRIVSLVCSGLHAAHELTDIDGSALNVVHRDVSPQNVLISASGQVKVADFGVAKAQGQLHRPTETGEVKGKLSYMAPEQVTSKDIDRRVDVFALGCVLYEATLGQRAFHGADALSTMYKILEAETTPPRQLDPEFPEELERIILRALTKERDARYQTAEEMRADLDRFLHSTGISVTEAQIGQAINAALTETIAARNKRIGDAIAALDAGDTMVQSPPSEEVQSDDAVSTTLPSEGTLSGGTLASQRRSPARRAGLFGAVAIGALGIATLAAVWLGRKGQETLPQPAVTSEAEVKTAPAPSPEPPRQEKIVVTIRATPANAELRIDDGEALPNPYVLTVLPDDGTHVITATAPGYAPNSQAVRFDRSQAISLALAKADAPEAERPAPIPRRPGPTVRATPSEPTSPATTPASPQPGELPPATRKPTRRLDTENPFENP